MSSVVLTQDHWIAADRRVFERKKKWIQGALEGDTGIISGVTEENKKEVFYMLCFCLCVPQSKAIKAEEAIELLRKKDFYTNELSESEVVECLEKRVRFHPTKSKRLLEARITFIEQDDFWERIKIYYNEYICYDYSNPSDREIILATLGAARRFIVESINGVGLKLGSHFLRNIGMPGLGIIDSHITDGLRKRGVISHEKPPVKKSEYFAVEWEERKYARLVGISIDELDLLLWSEKTGYVFK